MIKESDFYSQLLAFKSEQLKNATCGIACLAMAIKYNNGNLGRLDSYGKSLELFFSWLVKFHKTTTQTQMRSFNLAKVPTLVPVVHYGKGTLEKNDLIRKPYNIYDPVFSLEKGFDHRASSKILNAFGIKGDLIENLTLDMLAIMFEIEAVQFFIASTKYNGNSTHLVLIECISNEKIMIIDPNETNLVSARKVFTKGEFSKIYRCYGTAIWK